jgi:poly(A) polymerase
MRQQSRVAIPKRFTLPMREIIALQPRFERREGRRALRLLSHPRFRAAYDFLLLRAASGEVPEELASWWTDIQTASDEEKVARVEQRPTGEATSEPRRPGRRRRRRRRAPRA